MYSHPSDGKECSETMLLKNVVRKRCKISVGTKYADTVET